MKFLPYNVCMDIFDNIERFDTGLPDYDSSDYQFLNTSGQPEVQAARNRVQDLFDDYPNVGRRHLLGRLRSKYNQNFQGAFFELVLYRLLNRLGLTPTLSDLDDSQRCPDFLIADEASSLYVEATVHDPNKETIKITPHLRDALKKLDSIDGRGFGLHFSTEGELNDLVSKSILTNPIEQRIEQIITGSKDRMDIEITICNWKLTGHLVEAENNNDDRFVLGFTIGSETFINPNNTIRGKISEKTKRYKDLDAPMMLAINSKDMFFDVERHPISALFGKSLWDESVQPPRSVRQSDGIWITRKNTLPNSRLAGVLFFRSLDPFTFGPSNMFYPNPYLDESVLPADLYRLPYATYGRNMQIKFNEGEELSNLLFG